MIFRGIELLKFISIFICMSLFRKGAKSFPFPLISFPNFWSPSLMFASRCICPFGAGYFDTGAHPFRASGPELGQSQKLPL